MANYFSIPDFIISGTNALEEAAKGMVAYGKKALIVTDPVMVKLGNVGRVTDVLDECDISYSIFDGAATEPCDLIVMAGLEAYKKEDCQFLIAIGGGSPMDTMKAIALLVTCGGKMADYMGVAVDHENLPPMVAVPTTAGTGSEVTQFTIITDTATEVKMLLKGKSVMPSMAIIDPEFTMTMPAKVTAATGIDALCHSVEAFTSRKAQPMSDIFAKSAVKRIMANLKKVYDMPDDREARMEMALAATEAGIAFNNASVTIVHGMSRPIGALFHVAHGMSNAMLLGVCLEFIEGGAQSQLAVLGRECGIASENDSQELACRKFIDAVKQLLQDVDIPTPAECGIDREKFMQVVPKMTSDAMASGSPSNTRLHTEAADVEMLYKRLWQ